MDELENISDELKEEMFAKMQKKYNGDLMRLIHFFRSMDYAITDIKVIITLLLSVLRKTEKFDEEDIRDIFRLSESLQSRIVFKDM